jgi:hypothetical protein
MIEYWLMCAHVGFAAGFSMRLGWLATLIASIMIAGAALFITTILVIEQLTMQRSLAAEIIGGAVGFVGGLYAGGKFND